MESEKVFEEVDDVNGLDVGVTVRRVLALGVEEILGEALVLRETQEVREEEGQTAALLVIECVAVEEELLEELLQALREWRFVAVNAEDSDEVCVVMGVGDVVEHPDTWTLNEAE